MHIATLYHKIFNTHSSLLLAACLILSGHAQAQTEPKSTSSENQTTEGASSTSHRDLSTNECLKKLNDSDQVIASIAFKDGLNSSTQFRELVKRKPWGIGTSVTAEEIKAQLKTQSPFLIITLTKKQALTLDEHRDIIRWVLVQSTSKSCE